MSESVSDPLKHDERNRIMAWKGAAYASIGIAGGSDFGGGSLRVGHRAVESPVECEPAP